jgi:hypothetical protein
MSHCHKYTCEPTINKCVIVINTREPNVNNCEPTINKCVIVINKLEPNVNRCEPNINTPEPNINTCEPAINTPEPKKIYNKLYRNVTNPNRCHTEPVEVH